MRFHLRRCAAIFVLGTVAIGFAGCTGGSSKPVNQNQTVEAEDGAPGEQPDEGGKPAASTAEEKKPAASTEIAKVDPPKVDEKPAEPPFNPPPLAEIDAKAEWMDKPVLDGIEILRVKQAGEKPLCTVQEALALKNDSPLNNQKILSALGRLPESDGGVNWNAEINRHTAADVKSTNPIMISSTIEFDILDLTGVQLFGWDWNFKQLALKDTVVSWQDSKDHMYDKIVLRDDLTWSDGKPITAHDIAFTYKVIMDRRVPIPAVRSGCDKLKAVVAYDDHTVVYFHKNPLATNQENIYFPIIPKHVYEKSYEADTTLQDSPEHVALEKNPVCGGAYTIASRRLGQEMVLQRRESWYLHGGKEVRPKPYFKTIRFRVMKDANTARLALLNGDIDEMQLTPEQWTTQTTNDEFYAKDTKASEAEWTYFHFNWNLKNPLFSDVRVRKALAYAFDYKEMLDTLCYGLYRQSNGPFNPKAWMAPKNQPPLYSQDLDKAEQLLTEAGWEDHDGDGVLDKEINGKTVKFEFTVLCPNISDRPKFCALLKESLDKIGIVVNVKPLDFTVLQQLLLDHKFDASFGGWGTGTDPDTSDNIWVTGEGRNYGHYSNPEVDKLYDEGRKEFDRAKRAEIYGRIHELIYEDQPYMFLYYRNGFYGFSKELRGYTFSARGPYNFTPGFWSIYKSAP